MGLGKEVAFKSFNNLSAFECLDALSDMFVPWLFQWIKGEAFPHDNIITSINEL